MNPSTDQRRSGIALVVILFVLMLVAALAVAFLTLAGNERSSSAVFLSGTQVRQLADNAVGIVQAQINHATTQESTAWASQPGMIRTYAASGTFDTAYKLFSASTLTTTSAAAIANDLPPSSWPVSKAEWTDLNAPVEAGGITHYPIFDPSSALSSNPNEKVAGVSITAAPGATADRPAPMPVRWLYVLKDGQIVAPSSVTNDTATVSQANASNPITGRIAFWTDDESCKVNLNTAGAGSYWDTPHFSTTEDRKFATSQPLSGEFQRYPGHPAMTDLKKIFPGLTDQKILETLTPRYQWGGSQQGTIDTYTLTGPLANGQLADRPLIASVDELAFFSDTASRDANPNLAPAFLRKLEFFLTASSRAPELNLFDLPRVACWPIATQSTGRTAFDQLIAFNSTISGNPYYFQRESALSPTADAALSRNQQIFSYLQSLSGMSVPGFGVELDGKFAADTNQILTEIWDYIRSTNLYDSRLAIGQSFTPDPRQIASGLTPGYGYVVPLEVTSGGETYRGFGRSMTLSELAFVFICTADSVDEASPPDVLGLLKSNDPAKNLTLNGTALSATNKERRIQMMLLPELFSPSLGDALMLPKNFRISISGLSSLQINGQALFASNSEQLTVLDTGFNAGLTHARRLGGPFDFRAFLRDGGNPRRSALSWDSAGNTVYPFISLPVTIATTGVSPGDPGSMTFSTGTLTVTIESSADGTTWKTVQTFDIVPPASSAIPVPNLVRSGGAAAGTASNPTPATDPAHWWAFSLVSPMTDGTSGGRLNALESGPNGWRSDGPPYAEDGPGTVRPGSLFRGRDDASGTPEYTDVIRSMVPAHGDYRLIAASQHLPSAAFTPLGSWTATGAGGALIHTLGIGLQRASDIAGGSKFRRHFVTTNTIGSSNINHGSGGTYAPDFRSDAPNALLTAIASRGDFDNPPAAWPDGAYINKPDEGNVAKSASFIPYFGTGDTEVDSVAFFSPNRMISGPGMFGSLPTHVKRYLADPTHSEDYAWRTLLFRRQPGHGNAATITNGLPNIAPDHLLMDLFWMPTVEPYAISEPFATAGKINMNYQIQPFTYLQRRTGVLAVLASERMAAVPNGKSSKYKIGATTAAGLDATYRVGINAEATLSQFDTRFTNAATNGRIFLSPTELCDLWLVPDVSGYVATDASMQNYWQAHRLTGDNMRERPYINLIPRLTTKSNTYTVHFRVQLLKPRQPNVWDERSGVMAAEYRGSTTIERFIDPNDSTIPDYAASTDLASEPSLDKFYRWRTTENRTFAP